MTSYIVALKQKMTFLSEKSDLYYFSKGSLHPHMGLLNSDYIISLAFHAWLFQSNFLLLVLSSLFYFLY